MTTEPYVYTDAFLSALALWQRGWREDKDQRLALTADLREAIGGLRELPPQARQAPEWCYRKRFLVPNNPQNGGDFWPLFYDLQIPEGVGSWSTDYDYCKVIFKPEPRPDMVACIFRHQPSEAEVILNIAALWTRSDFVEAATDFVARSGLNAAGLDNFRNTQSEVILEAPLKLDEVYAFCGRVPSLDELCAAAGISAPDDEEELWQRLVKADYLPTMPFWLEHEAAQRAIARAQTKARKRMEEYRGAL